MRRVILLVGAVALGACFPTMQTPDIARGLRLDAGGMVLSDQTRNATPQGTDFMAWAAPVIGLGNVAEFGVPIGYYYEGSGVGGTSPNQLIVLPYAKFALMGEGADKLATTIQLGPTYVTSLGVLYGRDLGGWMPYGGVKWMASGGPAGDDPFITRYQEAGQLLLLFSGGVEWKGPGRPAVEVGVLLDHYREGALYGDFGQPTTPRTLFDLFVSARVSLGGR